MKRLVLLFTYCFIALAVCAQQSYVEQWKKVDALIQKKKLPKSALAAVKKIHAQAKAEGNEAQLLKAFVYQMDLQQELRENNERLAIAEANELLVTSREPYTSLYKSLIAGLYQRYYDEYRWQLSSRTNTTESDTADFAKWTTTDFRRAISRYYLASLQQKELLQKTPVVGFAAIIARGNVSALRPTLYDLLAHRALSFLEGGNDSNWDAPEDKFVLSDTALLSSAEVFSGTNFQSVDTASLHYKAVRIYRELLRLHIADENKDALIDADIARIEFIHQYAAMEEKDSLYERALNQLITKYIGNKTARQAGYLLAKHYNGQADSYKPLEDSTYRFGRVKAEAILKQIVADSTDINEGWINAHNLLQQIRKPSLVVSIEKVNLPGEPFRALVKYNNVDAVYARLIPSTSALRNQLDDLNDEDYWAIIARQKPLRTWRQTLPATADFQEHAVEIKIDALPAGEYFLVLSDNSNPKAEKATAAASHLWVSVISYVHRDNDFFVLHRKTGQPLSGAKVFAYERDYNSKLSRYVHTAAGTYTTNNRGFFHMPAKSLRGYYNYFRFQYSGETLAPDESLYLDRFTRQITTKARDTMAYFYTDRSLYRPGQTVHFKAIIASLGVKTDKTVVPSKAITVYLFDANNERRDSVQLTTNAYGSIADSFRLPGGLLNGYFSLRTQLGRQWSRTSFSVEEYKRPKFYAAFEPVTAAYKIGDSVRVTLSVNAYAGNSLSNAGITYRVQRSRRWGWWRRPFEYNDQQIAHGTGRTDNDGKFLIAFAALPDKKVDTADNPAFNYTVSATVTDINGETHSVDQTVVIGYAALSLSVTAPNKLPVDSFKKITIETENLQGNFIPSPLRLKLFKLMPENRLLRSRFWDRPDQFVMTKEEYIRHFPFDEYAAESDYKQWEKTAVDSFSTTSKENGQVMLQYARPLVAGHYLLQVTAVDKDGREVKAEQHIELYDQHGSGKPEFLWMHNNTKSLKPGEQKLVRLASTAGLDNLITETKRRGQLDSTRFAYGRLDSTATLRLDATEEDRGGYSFGLLTVKENRVYQHGGFVDVPWSNKELNVQLTTFRNRTEPGTKEQWKLKITGEAGKTVAAEMLASMYDASLDAMESFSWSNPPIWETYRPSLEWNGGDFRREESKDKQQYISEAELTKTYDAFLFDQKHSQPLWWLNPYEYQYTKQGELMLRAGYNGGIGFVGPPPPPTVETAKGIMNLELSEVSVGAYSLYRTSVTQTNFVSLNDKSAGYFSPLAYNSEADKITSQSAVATRNGASTIQPRKNLSETAFFLPFLTNDANGDVEVSFTVPEALTAWKFQAFAHTKELAFGSTTAKLITQKSLMVQPNLPRFVRQKDAFTLQAKISNLSAENLNGEALLQLFDAASGQPLNTTFGLTDGTVSFIAKAARSTMVDFKVSVPANYTGVLTWRITATASDKSNAVFSDGEEATLPVLPEKILLTESIPFVLKGNSFKQLRLQKLLQSAGSATIRHQSLTVEATTNPAWYAVQALPYLMEFPYECAEQTWNRYYANALASILATSSPQMEEMLRRWRADTAAAQSPLQKAQDLKSALLQETPWLAEAQTEAAQKRNLARLFDNERVATELSVNIAKLQNMQKSSGAFGWFSNGPNDRYITQYILTGIGRLLATKGLLKNAAKELQTIAINGLEYVDEQLLKEAQTKAEIKGATKPLYVSSYEVQYLYMRSFFKLYPQPTATKAMMVQLQNRLAKQWMNLSKQLQGMVALALYRSGDKTTAAAILKSLKETAIVSEERGMYWKEVEDRSSQHWEDAPVETTALLMEAFAEAGKDEMAVAALLNWLIQQKQTTYWDNTKSTAEACYAIFRHSNNLFGNNASVEIKLGADGANAVTANSADNDAEAGTGYFRKTIVAKDVRPDMGVMSVQAKSVAKNAPVWVNVYWQYFEAMQNTTAAASPLVVQKQLFIERISAKGAELTPISDTTALKPGDKLVVRLHLTTDRDLQYVHLKDLRASCLEPVNVLSSYHWQNDLGFYEETRDAATNFFLDMLPKGTHVFEYPVYVAQSGNFTNGIATAQCMYAPAFVAHSGGGRLRVK